MEMNWIKIALIMITINILMIFSINIYTANIEAEDIVGYYEENEEYTFDENKDMGIIPSVLLFNNSINNKTSDLKGDNPDVYYKTSQNFWNVIDGIINVGLFVGIFFEITLNVLTSNISLDLASNTTELYILAFIVFLVGIGNLVVIIKTVQFWLNKDTK
jgi:hypothetical protein